MPWDSAELIEQKFRIALNLVISHIFFQLLLISLVLTRRILYVIDTAFE